MDRAIAEHHVECRQMSATPHIGFGSAWGRSDIVCYRCGVDGPFHSKHAGRNNRQSCV
jgi:hypothetical protein